MHTTQQSNHTHYPASPVVFISSFIKVIKVLVRLTLISPVYNVAPLVDQRDAAHLILWVYYHSDSALLSMRGLTLKLKPDLYSLGL